MGQAAVDLPDPLQTPASASSSSTDDLLAQLADEEIDRLLSEADVASETVGVPASATSAAARPAPTPVAPDAANFKLDAPVGKDSDPELTAALDSLLQGMKEPPVSPLEPTADPEAEAASLPSMESVRTEPAADQQETETSSPERQALHPVLTASEAEDSFAPDDAPDEEATSLPVYLQPLEWLSAPLTGCSEPVRDVVGKIAILTLLNALAVLVYVFFIRA